MDPIFEKMKLAFDEKNNITLSKDELLAIAKKVSQVNTFSEQEFLPSECYVLVDRNLKDFYPFPAVQSLPAIPMVHSLCELIVNFLLKAPPESRS